MSGGPTEQQQRLITYIPLLTGNLSVLGSLTIIASIWRGRKEKMHRPQHRILLGLSIVDILYSLPKAWTFLLTPKDYPFSVPGAQGTMATCRMQGFFIQIAHIGGAYNAALSLYYYLTICKGMKQERFTKYIEPVVHTFFPLLNIGFGIAGVVTKLYNPIGFGPCFIGPYPPGCGGNTFPCELHGDDYNLMYEIFANMWVQAYMIVIIFTNLAIWWKVYTTEKAVSKYTVSLADKEMRQNQFKHSKRVAVQSTLYIAAYFLSWLGPVCFHLISWITGWQAFWPLMILVILTPLQGFFNAFIYARPQYLRMKERDPDMPRLTALKHAFFPPTERDARTAGSLQENRWNGTPTSTFRISNPFASKASNEGSQCSSQGAGTANKRTITSMVSSLEEGETAKEDTVVKNDEHYVERDRTVTFAEN